jgi:hypothetical protein
LTAVKYLLWAYIASSLTKLHNLCCDCHYYQTKQNQADAYRVAQRLAESTGKRHRLVDGDGRLIDLLNP